jgi:chromosome segregation protein
MRLERLELAGFKSFPDRADVSFDRGVTAIVGPNGCGKSNIVDAITWVLGEQSARSLRGERMEDVIFAGSDARKATSAAEVRLKFVGVVAKPKATAPAGDGASAEGESSVEEEPVLIEEPVARDVEVGRRLYRSGESEYLIDGHVCRLRDVQDLLMDVGVGVKGYAVIEQGKIGQILSSKPTDRRQLIEEAAGVTKFKSRRRQAELKLEAAQQNLTRVDDLIYELERQRAALKRQAAKARRYKRLREELRRWEKQLFAQRYERLRDAIRTARENLVGARDREALGAARLAEVESHLERLRIELAEADSLANTRRAEAHQRELDNERRQQQIAFDTQQAQALGQTALEILAELGVLEARRGPGREELAERREASRRADAERDAAAGLLRQEEQALAAIEREVVSLDAAVETARTALYRNLQSAATLQHAIERAEEGRNRIGGELSRLDVEAADLRIEAERLRGDRELAQAQLHEAQTSLESLVAAKQAAESELATARIEREWRQREARTLETTVAGTAARLRSLEELESSRAAYGDAARLVLATPEAGLAHRGSLADYLEVEPGSERAVEAALGELLQYVIVDSHADAERGLAFVRERGAGRCGFIVAAQELPSIDVSTPVPGGALGLDAALRVTGSHAAQIRWAIGDVWIVDAYDDAVRVSAAAPAATVVTRTGDVFRGGVLVTGGARDEGHGILHNKREIRDLVDRLAGERAALEAMSLEIAGFERTVTNAQERIAGLEAERHRQEKVILQHELHTARTGEELDRLARREELGAGERRRYEEERRLLDVRADEARQAIAELAGERELAEQQLMDAQQVLIARREATAAASRSAAEAKAASAALVERASALAIDVRRLEEASRELEARIAARGDERARTEQRKLDLERAVTDNRQRLDEDLVAYTALREDVAVCDARVDELQHEFEGVEHAVRGARSALDAIRAEASQFEVACATAESDLGHLAAACDEALQMTLEDVAAEVAQTVAAGEQPTPEASLASLDEPVEGEEVESEPAGAADDVRIEAAHTPEQAIARLKGKIDRLGPVNMMAIEQFDELEQRHTFLTTQRKDLLDSIEQTGEAIKRIEKTTRERFHEAFGTINEYFGTMFSTLFGGGKAGLVLLDEQDELESGIDIIAQPPGKRLQSVQLLSGGEKALTAMALMFALFRYRPSPFCLLDEIDAPLDDANIGRFVEMLRTMQDQTQFILITHHRKTMEIADRLYGVTMEEPGVSKLISIRLN